MACHKHKFAVHELFHTLIDAQTKLEVELKLQGPAQPLKLVENFHQDSALTTFRELHTHFALKRSIDCTF